MKKVLFLVLFSTLLVLAGCSDKPSVFSKKIEKDTGAISIKNPSAFLGAVTIGNTLDHEILVQASGGLDLFNLSVNLVTSDDFAFAGGTYPGTGGTCGTTLSSGSICKMVVRFQPTKISSQSAQFNFTFADNLASRSYSYQLTADSHPILTFEYGSSYDFGNKFVGSSTDLKIKISNTGRVVAQNIIINNMSAPYSFKGGSYPGTGGNCGSQLSPGETCDIIINYSPASRGQHLQDIVLNYLNNGRSEGNTLNLLAWGFTPAVLTVSSATGDSFGTVANGNAYTKTYTVTHASGDVAANLISLASLTAPFSRTGGTCSTVLTIEQQSCTIIVGLNSATTGNWSSAFNLSYFNGIQTVTLTKTMTASTKGKPVLTFSPGGLLDFGAVKRNLTSDITITVTYSSGEIEATSLNFPALTTPFSYSGGTCGATLGSGTCTKIIRFAPTADYKPPVTLPELQISYNDSTGTINAPLNTLKGSSDAQITGSAVSFGSVVTGETVERSLQLSNYSGVSATSFIPRALPAPFAYKGGSFPGTGGNCSSTFAPAPAGTSRSTCLIYLTYTPSLEQDDSASLVFDYNNGVENTSVSIALSGRGAPAASLTIENKTFPTTGLNSQVPAASLIKVTNTGSVTATSMSMASLPAGFLYKGGGSYPGTDGTCGGSLSGGSFCYLSLVFNPTIVKTYSETVTMNYYNGAATTSASFSLTGTGEHRAELYLSHYDVLRYTGTTYVGQTKDLTIQLGHGGGLTSATDIAPSTSSADFSVVSSTCTDTLINAQTCTLSVRFSPLSGGGTKTGLLNISYKVNGVNMIVSRSLSGYANVPGLLTITPAPFDFGAQTINSTTEQAFTVTKTGDYTLSVGGVTKTISGSGFQFKGGTYPGTGGTCPTSSSYSGSCTIVTTFTPVALTNYSGQIKFSYWNGYMSFDSTSALSGTGKAKLTYSQSTYDFGQVIQSRTSEKTITVSNPGAVSFTDLSFSALSAPYSFKGGTYPGTGGTCGSSLTSGQSCTLVLVFSPSTTGIQSSPITFTYDDGHISNAQSSATVTGEGIAQAIIGFSESNPYNFGTTNVNGIINKSFTLTNAGSVAGTNIAVTLNSAFSFLGGTFPGTGGTCSTTLNAGTNCTIVVSFKPTSAISYTGNMILNYDDGVRTQTEMKELRGTGSAVLNKDYYFSRLPLKTFSELSLESLLEKAQYLSSVYKTIVIPDINLDGEADKLKAVSHPQFLYIATSGRTGKILYRIRNHHPADLFQGISTVVLNEMKNEDQHKEILSGIYQLKDGNYSLAGYTIFCSRTGNILEQYLVNH